MKRYLKVVLSEQTKDNLRISLSVFAHKLSADPVCDFCGDESPVYVYRAKRMSDGSEVECWRWCACARCSYDIDYNHFRDLRHRIATRLQNMTGMPSKLVEQAVAFVLETFFDDAVEVNNV